MADVELPESLKCDGNFKLEIKRLSKEWRLKRDSFRTSVPIVEPEEQLVSAAAAGDLQRCRELLQRKAAAPDAAYAGRTALLAAAAAGKAESVAFLLDARASPRATPLHMAAEGANGKICLALLTARADPSVADERGLSPAALASNNEALWPLFSAAGCERVQPYPMAAATTLNLAGHNCVLHAAQLSHQHCTAGDSAATSESN